MSPDASALTDYESLSPHDAVALQRELRARVELTALTRPVRTVGGADLSFNKFSEVVYAGIVVLSYPSLEVLERRAVTTRTSFPYVPGLLGFREVPALLRVWELLEHRPDVLILDGHGIAHPRRLGVATHFGVVADTPTVGCAKSLLVGHHDPLPDAPGSVVDLVYKGEKIGELLRSKDRCNPLYVSQGHRITQAESTALVRGCLTRYRLPETTRLAHLLVNETRVAAGPEGAQKELF